MIDPKGQIPYWRLAPFGSKFEKRAATNFASTVDPTPADKKISIEDIYPGLASHQYPPQSPQSLSISKTIIKKKAKQLERHVEAAQARTFIGDIFRFAGSNLREVFLDLFKRPYGV